MRAGTVFYKMSGSGNDFLVVDGRYARLADFTPEAITGVCDRRLGIGADGVILLDPSAPEGAHFTFRFWNSDGSEGPMCGNGALCATRLASVLELAPANAEVRFVTRAGLHRGRVLAGRPEIFLPDCRVPELVQVAADPAESGRMFANPSVPHLVLLVDAVEGVELERRGPPLRHDPALPVGGANVNWVAPLGDGTFRMRTYERGVEGETLACGTGAVACALVLDPGEGTKGPVRIWTRSGLPLDVSWERRGDSISSIRLAGSAAIVFKGTVGEVVTPTKS